MSYFNQRRGFGGGDRGGRQGSGRPSFGDRSDRQMHQATCNQCGDNCEVPFRPDGRKPVYCSSCFESQNGESRDGGFRDRTQVARFDRGGSNSGFGGRKPWGQDRNDRGFGDNRGGERAPQSNNRDEFMIVNKKLDRILALLDNRPDAKEAVFESLLEDIAPMTEVTMTEKPKKAKAKKKSAKK
jgi:CxxC-x17-CxxC domain-containing protein